MILPIVAYGHPSLRRKNENITPEFEGLKDLIRDMYQTMYSARGVGLAAPQVDKPYRIFIVDGEPMDDAVEEGEESLVGWKKIFINPEIIEEEGEDWGFEEGCLSIPDIRETVFRPETIKVRYFDQHFEQYEEVLTGMRARIFQHEYDHLEGVLFVDHLSPFRKQLVKSKLSRIQKGKIEPSYSMKFVGGK